MLNFWFDFFSLTVDFLSNIKTKTTNQCLNKKSSQCLKNKIMLNQFDLKFIVGPYMIYFCFLWGKFILTVDFHVTEKEGLTIVAVRSRSAKLTFNRYPFNISVKSLIPVTALVSHVLLHFLGRISFWDLLKTSSYKNKYWW